MKFFTCLAALALCTVSTAHAASLTFENALFRSENTANTNYRTANLGAQPSAEDRRVPISGFERGLVAQGENLNFSHTISGNRAVTGNFTNVAQGFFKDQDFFVNADIDIGVTCLGNPTAGTCPPRIEASNAFRFDFSVDEDATLNFAGIYDRGRNIRHISDDQTILSIFNADRNRTIFFSGSSNPNLSDYIFNQTTGGFTGSLDLEAGINYRFSLFQAAEATGGPVGVEITDRAAFRFAATLTETAPSIQNSLARLNAEISGVAPVPLPAAGWLLLAGIAGLGTAGKRSAAKRKAA